MPKLAFTLLAISILLSCIAPTPNPEPAVSEYQQQILDWHQTRNDRLKQPDSWLTLSGLFWLEEGDNSFGGSAENDLIFPGKDIPGLMGYLSLQDDSVRLRVVDGIEIRLGDSIVTETGLKQDGSGEPDILTWGSLSWYVIERGERIGVRLRDSAHPNILNFKPTELFPIDPRWRVPATLEVFDTLRTVEIINVLGDASPSATPGVLHFEINGQNLTLTPLADPGDDSYFIIFGDGTNGISSYGAGRFLVVAPVDETGKTFIDFNKAYNMPCAFSPYATCPLPPPENLLAIAIAAGEKDYHIPGGH